MNEFLVCGDEQWYPWVYRFNSLEEAKEFYDKRVESCCRGDHVFLCKVLKYCDSVEYGDLDE